MADNNSNIIKPVEGLHNIAGLAPTKRREQRKRRQDLQEQNKQKSEHQSDADETLDQQNLTDEPDENENDQSTIDYCA